MSKQVPPVAVMNFLNWLFTGFDDLAEQHKVWEEGFDAMYLNPLTLLVGICLL